MTGGISNNVDLISAPLWLIPLTFNTRAQNPHVETLSMIIVTQTLILVSLIKDKLSI